ncbi:glycoside hydrolase superfamily [Peziza echinospora]|nr:glycoside hydrolase superfamily [Peziza echinospora]
MANINFCGLLAFTLVALSGVSALVAKDGHTGRLPAMGFNSWNAFQCDINEAVFLTAAENIKKLGLFDLGYNYVNIDDCWADLTLWRDNKTQRIIPDYKKFPDGISGTAKKVHEIGLKMGIYSDAGEKTCAGYPGSLYYEDVDAATFSDWGIDYLKYDNCYVPENWTDPYHWEQPFSDAPLDTDWGATLTAERYYRMRDALLKQKRVINYGLCDWGQALVETWGNATGMSWRLTGDIGPAWEKLAPIISFTQSKQEYSNFWGHNDMDMLEIGNGDLTQAEQRTHFGMWAVMKSPLFIGTPLDKISPFSLSILKNKDFINFNQDPHVGPPAKLYKLGNGQDRGWKWNETMPGEYWSGNSSKGMHVFVINGLNKTTTKRIEFSEVPGLKVGTLRFYRLWDMWKGKTRILGVSWYICTRARMHPLSVAALALLYATHHKNIKYIR